MFAGKPRFLKVLLQVSVFASLLVACAAPAAAPQQGAAGTSATPAQAAAPAASGGATTVARKDILVIPGNVNIPAPDIWNPYIPGTYILQGMNQNMMEPLFMLNYETGNIDGWLAESYAANETMDEWTVTLRAGHRVERWHAADLRRTWSSPSTC